jgi:hypothetical protein
MIGITIKDLELHQLQNLNNILHMELLEYYEHLLFVRLRAKVMITLARLLDRYQKVLNERLMERDKNKRDKLTKKLKKYKSIDLKLPYEEAKLLRHVLGKLSAEEQHNFEVLSHFVSLNYDVSEVAKYQLGTGRSDA